MTYPLDREISGAPPKIAEHLRRFRLKMLDDLDAFEAECVVAGCGPDECRTARALASGAIWANVVAAMVVDKRGVGLPESDVSQESLTVMALLLPPQLFSAVEEYRALARARKNAT